MIGIVVVSHSPALADAAIALATEMLGSGARPVVLAAAGTAAGETGTDAVGIADAITSADSGDGVLVLLDLGSAILSAEMALEFIDPDVAERVRLSPAPMVEGLVATVVTAAGGAPLATCAAEAANGLHAKASHLDAVADVAETAPGTIAENLDQGAALVFRGVIDLSHGLHARPAAALTTALGKFDVVARARNASTRTPWADARSVTGLAGLGLGPGEEIEVELTGPDAVAARDAVSSLVADRFGEIQTPPAPVGAVVPITGLVHRLAPPDLSQYVPGETEEARLSAAVDVVGAFWSSHAGGPFDAIVRAQQALLLDRHFLAPAYDALATGASAPAGVALAVGQNALRFERLPAYLRARAEDVRGLGRLLVLALLGEPLAAQLPAASYVLVLAELDVGTALGLDPSACAGVVTWMGSPQGHGALMCGELGIPIRTGQLSARELAAGDFIDLDATGL